MVQTIKASDGRTLEISDDTFLQTETLKELMGAIRELASVMRSGR